MAAFRTSSIGRTATYYTLSLSTISSPIFTSCIVYCALGRRAALTLNSFLDTTPTERSLSSPFCRYVGGSFISIVKPGVMCRIGLRDALSGPLARLPR
jgi:hypothetical protein